MHIKRLNENELEIKDGGSTIIVKIGEPSKYYSELRKLEYPTLEEQNDMQYWDTINNTTKWTDLITEIKNKYPKG